MSQQHRNLVSQSKNKEPYHIDRSLIGNHDGSGSLLAAQLAQTSAHIDQAGTDDFVRCVDDATGCELLWAHSGNVGNGRHF
jgi:hypothetical protein